MKNCQIVTMISRRKIVNPYKIRLLDLGKRKPLSHQTIRRPSSTKEQQRQFNGLRHASTLASPVIRPRNIFYGGALILGSGLLYLYITDTRASVHRWLVVPALRLLYGVAEEAHHAGNSALKLLWQFGLYPRERGEPDRTGDLQVEVFGYDLVNPLATSAGIDKKC